MNWGEEQKDVHSQIRLLLLRTYLHNLVQLWGSSPAPVDERHTGCTKLAKGLTWLENSYLNQCYKRLQSIKSQTIPFFCSGVLPCLESIVCCLNSCLQICISWYEVHWVLRLIPECPLWTCQVQSREPEAYLNFHPSLNSYSLLYLTHLSSGLEVKLFLRYSNVLSMV